MDAFWRFLCASPNTPMDPGFSTFAGFLAWEKVPIIVTVDANIWSSQWKTSDPAWGCISRAEWQSLVCYVKEYMKVLDQARDLRRPFHTALTRGTGERLKALVYMLKIKAKTSKRPQDGGLGKIKVILFCIAWEEKIGTCLTYTSTLNFLYHYPCLGFAVMLHSIKKHLSAFRWRIPDSLMFVTSHSLSVKGRALQRRSGLDMWFHVIPFLILKHWVGGYGREMMPKAIKDLGSILSRYFATFWFV